MNSQRVIIVHLRRANFQLQAKEKLNCGRKVWDELCKLQELSQGGVGRGLCERRVTRTFLVNNKYFSIRLFLFQTKSKFYHRATIFYHRLQEKREKVLVSVLSSTTKDCVPTTNMLTHQILRRRIKLEFKKLHMLLTYRKFNQLIYLFS